MELNPVTILKKGNKARLKKLTMKSHQQIVTPLSSLSFFRFMTNLKQSGTFIPDVWSVILTCPLVINLYI